MQQPFLNPGPASDTDIFQVYGSSKLVTAVGISSVSTGTSYAFQAVVESGTIGPVVAGGTFIAWNSPASGPKTQPLPESIGSLQVITISDVYGDAGTYPITPLPPYGSVIGAVSTVYTNHGSMTLIDTNVGWCSI